MPRDYLLFSAISAVWSTLVAIIGGALDWSDDAMLGVALLAVPVLILIWGHRDEVRRREQREQPVA
jgi:hypothetical protein